MPLRRWRNQLGWRSWRPTFSDADDEMVLETAVNGRAEEIVTFNPRDFAVSPEQFGIGVLLPGEAIKRLEHGP
jgi:predicted nucleic acid-binding protein